MKRTGLQAGCLLAALAVGVMPASAERDWTQSAMKLVQSVRDRVGPYVELAKAKQTMARNFSSVHERGDEPAIFTSEWPPSKCNKSAVSQARNLLASSPFIEDSVVEKAARIEVCGFNPISGDYCLKFTRQIVENCSGSVNLDKALRNEATFIVERPFLNIPYEQDCEIVVQEIVQKGSLKLKEPHETVRLTITTRERRHWKKDGAYPVQHI
ncbi:MAG: hypothetical protein HY552_06540 [Elusimicrobia bacterium]|nr:hypothetical protein [Elusimicrobiota bacterium]